MNNRIQNNPPSLPVRVLDLEGGEETPEELFTNFTQIQTVGYGDSLVQMTAGREGNPAIRSSALTVKLEPIETASTPLISRQIAVPSNANPNKRPGDLIENPRPLQMPRTVPADQRVQGVDGQAQLIENQQRREEIQQRQQVLQQRQLELQQRQYQLQQGHAGNLFPPALSNFQIESFAFRPFYSQQMYPGLPVYAAPMSTNTFRALPLTIPSQNNFPVMQVQAPLQASQGIADYSYPDLVQRYLVVIRKRMGDKNFKGAQELCAECVKDPRFAELTPMIKGELHHILASALYLQNKKTEGDKSFEELLKYSEYIDTLSERKQGALYNLLGDMHFNQKDWVGAKEFYEKCVKCLEFIADFGKALIGQLFYRLAVASTGQNEKDYVRAKEAFDECFKYPEFIRTLTEVGKGLFYSIFGDVCYRQKDNVKMLEAYENCLKCPEFLAQTDLLRKASIYCRMFNFCSQSNDDSLKLKAMVYLIICVGYLKSVADDEPLKAEILSTYKSLGTGEELLAKLSASLANPNSNVPNKLIWHAVTILGQLNEV